MHDRALQPSVAVVAPHEKIKTVSVDPPLCLHARQLRPAKTSLWFCLIPAVDQQSIMGAGAAKHITLRIRSHVLERARIDEQLTSLAVHANTKRVSMAMPRCEGSLRTGIKRQLLSRFRVRHHVQTADP